MTMVDIRHEPEEVLDEAQGRDRACYCWHGIPGRSVFLAHEFSHWDTHSPPGRHRCVQRSRLRGIWLCESGHGHVAMVRDECRTYHDADSAAGYLRLVWEQIHG